MANLSDIEFKTLVIRMLREMIEYGRKIKEEMKALQREIYREPKVKAKKPGLKSMIWNERTK